MHPVHTTHDVTDTRANGPVVVRSCPVMVATAAHIGHLRWRSTDASKNVSREGGVLVDGAVSKTARLDGFDPHAPSSSASAHYRQQRDRQQRLQRQRGAVTARFTASA